MSLFIRWGTRYFPNVFSPGEIGNVITPSLSGIFKRIIYPPQTVQGPNGPYKVFTISYKESVRLQEATERKLIESFPKDRYHEIEVIETSK